MFSYKCNPWKNTEKIEFSVTVDVLMDDKDFDFLKYIFYLQQRTCFLDVG